MEICLECGREFTNMNSLSRHIGTHMTQEEYFDKYLRKSEQDGKCVICGKPTRFRNFSYSNCCSQSCRNTWINQNRTAEERQKLSEKISQAHKTEQVLEKTRQTNIAKYGVPYTTQNIDVQEKRRTTCQKKYGTDYSFQAEEVKEKIQQSIHNHFGEQGLKAPEVREKTINTCQERYGTTNGGASKQAQEKIRKTTFEHFGVETSFQAQEVKDKIKQTCQSRYGVDYASQSKEVQQKIAETNLQKYGVRCQYQRPDLREKLNDKDVITKKYETKRKNGTFNASKPEDRCYELLQSIFPNAIHHYTSEVYPFECDMYVPELDLYIECNFFWSHGGHFFDSNNTNDLEKLTKWKDKNTKFYDIAIKVWTIYDPQKLETAKKNNLNYFVCWTEEEFRAVFDRDFSMHEEIPSNITNVTQVAKLANWTEYFKREIELLKEPAVLGELFINRYKYLGKLPHQLSNLALLNGLSISGKLRKYSTFDTCGMVQFIEKYQPASIYDPCAGWGERLLTCHQYGIKYFGVDINFKTVEGLNTLIDAYNINATVLCKDSSQVDSNTCECLFTCPPYWNTEIYTKQGAENLSYEDFLSWWKTVIHKSNCKLVAYQINQKFKKDINQQLLDLGYSFIEEIVLPQKSSHFTRKDGNRKKEYESIQVFIKK